MKNQIERNKELLLEEIEKLGNGNMDGARAKWLAVFGGAYKTLDMVCGDDPTAEEKAASHHHKKLDQAEITHWMFDLENDDGTTGPHYTKDQVEQYRRSLGISCDLMELYAAVNMIYSDYCRVLKKYGVDRPEVYVELAKAFLDDKDAGAKDKLAAYYEYIVEGK